ncbi:MAG: MoxR family ATPase [Oscillospiraceae bacterium]|nr:MoxR family ATPase [Oscillospiraceae bacterium]
MLTRSDNFSEKEYSRAFSEIIRQVQKVIINKDSAVIKTLMAILAGGHILIEDVPGVGKTSLALAFSRAMELDYKRLQFTTDVLPGDVTGFSVFNKQTGKFEYKKGAAICNLFLADEINRASSKTQSALLEIMEEGSVTVDGVTYKLPQPYIVIATQNPVGSVGTQLLPESQLDRFMIKISMGYPDKKSEINILKGRQTENPLDSVQKVAQAQDILKLQKIVAETYISNPVYEYIVELVSQTRTEPMIKLGLSPRGSIAVMKIAKACAFAKGRNFVIPDDVITVFPDVAAHRILLNPKAKATGVTDRKIIADIIRRIPVPEPRSTGRHL